VALLELKLLVLVDAASESSSLKEARMKMRIAASTAILGLSLLAPLSVSVGAKEEMLMAAVPANGITVSDYYKQSVYDTKDNKIGDVNDVLLDKSGQVSAVILGVGGFLGLGEKDVAVPFSAIQVTEKNGDRYLVMETTKEALQAATGYTYDHTKRAWVPATKQAG
jgi:sporulation protein YlmC with PRC-barrel domain